MKIVNTIIAAICLTIASCGQNDASPKELDVTTNGQDNNSFEELEKAIGKDRVAITQNVFLAGVNIGIAVERDVRDPSFDTEDKKMLAIDALTKLGMNLFPKDHTYNHWKKTGRIVEDDLVSPSK